MKEKIGFKKESDLTKVAQQFFFVHGIENWRVPVGPVLHQQGHRTGSKAFWKPSPLKGFPDWAGVLTKTYKGVFWAIELKSTTGKLSPDQAEWLTRLTRAGAKTAVIRTLADLEYFFSVVCLEINQKSEQPPQ